MPLRRPKTKCPPPSRTDETPSAPGARLLSFVTKLASLSAFKVQILGLQGGAPAGPGGFFGERSVISLEAVGSNLDVYIDTPATWTSNGAIASKLRVYATHQAATVCVAEFSLSALPWLVSPDGTRQTAIVTAHGHPSERWDVRIATNNQELINGVTLLDARFGVHAWGDQSTPEQGGETLSISQANPAPYRSDLAYAQDSSAAIGAGRWFPVGGTISNGRASLNVAPASPGTFANASATTRSGITSAVAGIKAVSYTASNGSNLGLFFGLVDTNVAPAPGDGLQAVSFVGPQSTLRMPFSFAGRPMVRGAAWAWSVRPDVVELPLSTDFLGASYVEVA